MRRHEGGVDPDHSRRTLTGIVRRCHADRIRRPSLSISGRPCMRHLLPGRVFLLIMLMVLAASGTAGARDRGLPITLTEATAGLDQVMVRELEPIFPEELLAEDAARASRAPVPLRYAVPEAVAITPDNGGTWEELADGSRLWRLRISAPNATDLNFGFTRFRLPPGASLFVIASHRAMCADPTPPPITGPTGSCGLPWCQARGDRRAAHPPGGRRSLPSSSWGSRTRVPRPVQARSLTGGGALQHRRHLPRRATTGGTKSTASRVTPSPARAARSCAPASSSPMRRVISDPSSCPPSTAAWTPPATSRW